jgi:hypothetical protein
MNIFKKIKLYWYFKRVIKSNKVTLQSNFNLRIDRADRLYSVLNIPENVFEDPYNTRKSDIETISQTYVRQYINDVSNYLDSLGLQELYDYYEPVKRVEKYSYLVVIGYKPFNSVEYNTIVYYRLLPIISVISLIGLLLIIF